MFELNILGTTYEFNFGIGFVKEINKTYQRPIDGMPGAKEDVGLSVKIAQVLSGDVPVLIDVLERANKGKDPRITAEILEKYVDDEDTDIDVLFDKVIGFFEKSNSCKRVTKNMKEAMEKIGNQ
ncbi:MAG: tail assembly chaperone [Christensenellales bacterium]|jgi:hypothetical protein